MASAPPAATAASLTGGTAADLRLSEAQWARVAALLPGSTGRGRPARHQRQHLEGLLWLRQTGASWRALPSAYGPWQTVYSAFGRWYADGTWQRALALLSPENTEVSL